MKTKNLYICPQVEVKKIISAHILLVSPAIVIPSGNIDPEEGSGMIGG